MLGRVLLVTASAAVIVWLGIWLHQTHAYDEAHREAVAPGVTRDPGRIRKVEMLFERARAHTPDTLPLVAEAVFLLEVGRLRRATPLVEQTLRREPRNVSAWALLGEVDPARAREARARIARLNPFALRKR